VQITQQQLSALIPNNPYVGQWCEALNQILPDYDIDTPHRVAAFVAQCAHESGNFTTLKENLNYRAESLMRVWPRYFPTREIADQYAHKPDAIANRAYGGRMGNGPESSGDGSKFSGRGLIQLTGRNNYQAFADSLDMNIDDVPAYLATFEGAVASAGWFWKTNNLNQYADSGDIVTMTKRINGGTMGLEDRQRHYTHALKIVLGSGDRATDTVPESVKKGMKGDVVKQVQTALGITADGDFGPGTEKAVVEWQAANGLVADGIVGPKSLKLLLG
jgi:putative chitinase